MEDGQMGHGNSECGYFYHSGLEDDFDSEREEELPHTSSESMPPKPKTAATVALYDPKEPSGGCTGVFTQGPNDSTKRKNKKRRTAASSPNTTPVSLDAHVGNVGTHGASQSRENARQHAQKLFDTMVTRTNHVDNPPKWDEGSEEDFCKQQTFTRFAGYLSDVTENNSESGHRTPEGNLLLCSTALTYLQDLFQVLKSRYESTGTDKTKLFFLSATQVFDTPQMS